MPPSYRPINAILLAILDKPVTPATNFSKHIHPHAIDTTHELAVSYL
jgi:hypothetical protein